MQPSAAQQILSCLIILNLFINATPGTAVIPLSLLSHQSLLIFLSISPKLSASFSSVSFYQMFLFHSVWALQLCNCLLPLFYLIASISSSVCLRLPFSPRRQIVGMRSETVCSCVCEQVSIWMWI